jgi:hypothetical protein
MVSPVGIRFVGIRFVGIATYQQKYQQNVGMP